MDKALNSLKEVVNAYRSKAMEEKVITNKSGNRFIQLPSGFFVPTSDWQIYRDGFVYGCTEQYLQVAELADKALKTDRRLVYFLTRTMVEMLVHEAIYAGATSCKKDEFIDYSALLNAYVSYLMSTEDLILKTLCVEGLDYCQKKNYPWVEHFEAPGSPIDNEFINKKQKQLYDYQIQTWVSVAKKEVLSSLSKDFNKIKTAMEVVPSLVLHGNFAAISMVTGDKSKTRELAHTWLVEKFNEYAAKVAD